MTDNETILVNITDIAATRGRGPKELEIEALAENVNRFLTKIKSILSKALMR